MAIFLGRSPSCTPSSRDGSRDRAVPDAGEAGVAGGAFRRGDLVSYRTLGGLGVAAYVVASVAGLADCSTDGPSYSVVDGVPATSSWDGPLPAVVPTSCAGQTYYVVAAAAACGNGPTYFICDGTAYTNYECGAPGNGWTLETAVPDPGASVAENSVGTSGSSSSASTTAPTTSSSSVGTGSAVSLPPSCSPNTFYIPAAEPTICGGKQAWFLCNSGSFDQFSCQDPGPGWSQETTVPDPYASTSSSSGIQVGTRSSGTSNGGTSASSSSTGPAGSSSNGTRASSGGQSSGSTGSGGSSGSATDLGSAGSSGASGSESSS